MATRKRLHITIISTLVCTVGSSDAPAFGDELTVTVTKDTFEQYEPIVVDVVLHLEEPCSLSTTDPVIRSRQDLMLRRRFVAELWDRKGMIATARLWSGDFALLEDRQTEFRATYLGCLGNELPGKPQSEFVFFDKTGTFTLIVHDVDSDIRSNAIPLKISSPSDARAAELFQSGGVKSLALILVQEYGNSMLSTFQTLEDKYGDTIYGEYARAALTLRRYESLRKPGSAPLGADTRQELRRDVGDITGLFSPGHPLRNHALLALARLNIGDDNGGNVYATLNILLQEARDGAYIREATTLSKELERRGHITPANDSE